MEPIPSLTLHESTLPLPCARRLKGVRASFVVKTIGCGRASVSCHCQSKKDLEKLYPKACVFGALNLVTELKFVKKPLCKYFRGKHHSLLHLEPVKSQPEEANSKSSESPSSSTTPPSSSSIVASSIAVNSGEKVILQTVPAVLCGSNGCKRLSDVSLIPAPKRPLSNRVWLKSLVLMGRL